MPSMIAHEMTSFFRRQVSRVSSGSPSSWTGYIFVVAVEWILFVISLKVQTEPEVLFSLFYVFSAVFAAIFLGRGPGIVAGVLASVSVSYHYIRPVGHSFSSLHELGFLILTLGVVQLTLLGVRLLQSTAKETETARNRLQQVVLENEEILATIAHDLRQPLSAVSLKQQLASKILKNELDLEGPVRSDQVHAVARLLIDCKRGVEQMNQLIQSLLETAKVELNSFSDTDECTDFVEVCRNVFDMFSEQAAKKSLALRFLPPIQPLPAMKVDAYRISRVLSNLISNAIKFTPERGMVELSITHLSTHQVEVRIRDSGKGIAKENIEKLFHKHWQDKATAHLGSGLGLFICQGIVAAHGGKLWYEPSKLLGATFCFRLPIVEATSDSHPGLALPRTAEAIEAPSVVRLVAPKR